jgi:tetratricopeptide (TPR) repeat protein
LKDNVSAKERALIEALANRYSEDPEADRAALDTAYAKAMKGLYAQYPDDANIATLYAASIMDLNPWGYWSKDGSPRANTETAAQVLEKAIEIDPRNTGALHYYIHLVEEHYPDKAEPAADQLTKLAPNAGHLVHMPSHIFMRLGRYSDAYEANKLAVLADEGYITACRNQGIYPLAYYPHNIHFQCWAAEREGHKEEAIRLARKVGAKALEAGDLGADFALQGAFISMPYYALVRFGEWDQILKEPAPPAHVPYARGMHHYARGLAYLFTDKTREAKAELEQLENVRNLPAIQEEFVGFATAPVLLEIASSVLQGELAAKAGKADEALVHLEHAVRLEDGLTYNEPPDWPIPARHNLGAVLLEADRPTDAESVYWTDLKKNPNNGYAMFGLIEALKAQGKDDAAEEMSARFEEVWATADAQLSSSRF